MPDRIFPAVLECRGKHKMCSGNFSMWGIEGNKSPYGNNILYHKSNCTGNTRSFIYIRVIYIMKVWKAVYSCTVAR